jgi:hypothetical protein
MTLLIAFISRRLGGTTQERGCQGARPARMESYLVRIRVGAIYHCWDGLLLPRYHLSYGYTMGTKIRGPNQDLCSAEYVSETTHVRFRASQGGDLRGIRLYINRPLSSSSPRPNYHYKLDL